MREIVISESAACQRLDKFLQKTLDKAPKGFIYKMIRKKNIKLNGARAEGHTMLAVGDKITLFLSDETIAGFTTERAVRVAGALHVVYEDGYVLICDKPAGVLVHPERAADKDTMVHRAQYYLYHKGTYDPADRAAFAPAFCNRLDRNTSGLVVCAKTLAAAQWLNKAFADRKAEKRYRAVVCGRLDAAGILGGYMTKDAANKKAIVHRIEAPPAEAEASPAFAKAKAVHTRYVPIWHQNGCSYLDVTIATGKFHQIRAHFAQIGHPIVGDVKYGRADINERFRRRAGVTSPMLHAWQLTFTETAGALGYLAGQTFEAGLPPMFKQGLTLLENGG